MTVFADEAEKAALCLDVEHWLQESHKLAVEVAYRPPMWLHAALWLPLTVVLALVLLAPIKGTLVALQWALLMHGFDPDAKEEIGDLAESEEDVLSYALFPQVAREFLELRRAGKVTPIEAPRVFPAEEPAKKAVVTSKQVSEW